MIESLIPHLSIWWGTIKALITLAGFILFFWTLLQMSGNRERRSWGRHIFALVAAVLLININPLLDSLARSLFGTDSIQSLSYQPPEHPARFYIQFAIYLIAIIGLIGIARGILLLKDSGSQPGRLSVALVHIFGGILCVNLVTTLKVMGRSLGREVLELITIITG
jgi:hypothetical protein